MRVLVVDDSAFARKVLRETLEGASGIEVVGTARDGLEALEKVAEHAPDVMTLDLAMPNLDGLGVLRALSDRPGPRVVVVSIAEIGGEQGIAALAAGAIEVIHKPTALATDRLYELSGELVRAVRTAAGARLGPSVARETAAMPGGLSAPRTAPARRLVVIGASTGGPQAVTRILKGLPKDFPLPLGVVVHLPPGYTAPFAERLDGECAIRVQEAEEGMAFEPGLAIIGRAGLHLEVRTVRGRLQAANELEPAGTPHRPAVDVLFTSAAKAAGDGTLAVVLTGMGEDGLAGARAVRAAGGIVLTETEASCVVYGMPRAVWEAGLATAEAPLSRMAAEILARS